MQGIAQGGCGERDGKGICQRVVDDEINGSGQTVFAGAAENVDLLPAEVIAVIYVRSHEPVPQQNGKVIGAGQEGAVLQKPVVRGGQRVVEDHAVGDGAVAAQLVERAQNIQIGGGPGISAAAGITGFGDPHGAAWAAAQSGATAR